MLGVKVMLLMLLGQVPEGQAKPNELVSRLGANRYAEREAASVALEGVGRPALPALRAARGSRDPEVRNRATGLVQRIEGSLLTQPTRIRLQRNTLTKARALSNAVSIELGTRRETLSSMPSQTRTRRR